VGVTLGLGDGGCRLAAAAGSGRLSLAGGCGSRLQPRQSGLRAAGGQRSARPARAAARRRPRRPRAAPAAQAETGALPRPGHAGDASKLLELVDAVNARAPRDARIDIDDAARGVLRKFASGGSLAGARRVFCRGPARGGAAAGCGSAPLRS
jgi:hypothetical protein